MCNNELIMFMNVANNIKIPKNIVVFIKYNNVFLTFTAHFNDN